MYLVGREIPDKFRQIQGQARKTKGVRVEKKKAVELANRSTWHLLYIT